LKRKLPAIIVTGASGLVGRNFVAAARDSYIIYAIARRSMKEAGVEEHPNIRWIHCDTTHRRQLGDAFKKIASEGKVEFVIHLAAYYDFEYKYNPAYDRTNIDGTRNVLDECVRLKPRRFIFASSSAASNFPEPGVPLNEDSVLDADYDYARSKREGEKLVMEYSKEFPCAIVRLAAVFTDWCEYPPLYMFLKTWLSKSWNSRIIGGKGESAVPYIHVHDLNLLLLAVIARNANIPRQCIFLAGPDGSTTHNELFDIATRCYYGRRIRPLRVPKIIAVPGVWARYIFGRLVSRIPFEKPWMMRYIDLKLDLDSSRTREMLGWSPTPRYHPLRRLVFLIEKMKTMPVEWHFRNRSAMIKTDRRQNLVIYNMFFDAKEQVIHKIVSGLRSDARAKDFHSYRQMNPDDLRWFVSMFYQMIMASVRNSDRSMLVTYSQDLAHLRIAESFDETEVVLATGEIGKIIIEELSASCTDESLKLPLRDHIGISIQLIIDEIEDVYEDTGRHGSTSRKQIQSRIERRLREIDSFYKPF
jgi:nucleoside-diphosphate-sugar epimerase